MDKTRSQAFMRKMVTDVGTAMSAALVHVGDRVGLFRAMAGAGDLDAAALSERTGITERYVHMQRRLCCTAGILNEHLTFTPHFVTTQMGNHE